MTDVHLPPEQRNPRRHNTPHLILTVILVLSVFTPGNSLAQLSEDASLWGQEVQRKVAAREYWVTWQDSPQVEGMPGAWHANNRQQGFRAYFNPDGAHVIPRNGVPDWSWGLSLVAWGRGTNSQPVTPAKLFPDENRVRLNHEDIDEWFTNEPRGLKHGFVIHAPPPTDSDTGGGQDAVHLDLRIHGTLTPSAVDGDHSVHFAAPPGVGTVYYRGLEVRDASERKLPAWMETHIASGTWTVRLFIDDRHAVYPVEVDPLATTTAWTGQVNQPNARLGIYLSSAGDINSDGYDDLIVGAYFFDNGENNEGAAFLFLGSDAGPSTTPDWMIEGNEATALAGRSVGTAGDVNGDGYDDVVVGVPGLDNGGGTWVFHGSDAGLSETADWAVQSNQPSNASFGFKVGTAGDVNGDGYDDVIVGAKLYDWDSPPGITQDGRAFVYHGSSLGLSLAPDWVTAGSQSHAAYGQSVNSAGDVNGDGYDDVIVGAYEYDNGETDEGRAYVYFGSPSGLSIEPDWIYENDDVRACLGGNVNTAGDVNNDGYSDVIVGAAYLQCWNLPDSTIGKAYVFHGSASGLTTEPVSIAELRGGSSMFGRSVGTAGDVNNDGYSDVVVGAHYFDNGETDEGAVFLFLGSEAGISTEPAWIAEGDQADSRFGASVAAAGNVFGDGVGGVVVGAFRYDLGEDDEGAAFLYQASSTVAPAGSVPAETPLRLAKSRGSSLELNWGNSCLASDVDYEVYEGQIGDFSSHDPRTCSTGNETTNTLIPESGNTYYLIVPRNANREGSYGTTSESTERTPGTHACLLQAVASCETDKPPERRDNS